MGQPMPASMSREQYLFRLIGSYGVVSAVMTLLLVVGSAFFFIAPVIPWFVVEMVVVAALVGISAGRNGPCWLLIACQILIAVGLAVLAAVAPDNGGGVFLVVIGTAIGNAGFAFFTAAGVLEPRPDGASSRGNLHRSPESEQ